MSLPLSRRALRPLALALPLALTLTACDSTEDNGAIDATASVYATSNPSGADADAVVRLSAGLDSTEATFAGLTGVTSVQNVFLTQDGNGYLTVDTGTALAPLGAIVYVPDLCVEDSDGCLNVGTGIGAGTRVVVGPLTGLVAPKGIINVEDRLVVADNGGSGAIRVFTQAATGDQAPQFTVTNLTGATNVWDVAYNEDDDMLFVAGTNGVVLVYDDFFNDRGATGPDRTITPTDGTAKISVNLHGIAYDRGSDVLVLSDVGAASGGDFATDGQVFTIANASTATGNTAVRYRISGSGTGLGNPVDVALSSAGTLYVAEKANGRVLRYDGILTATGSASAGANASVAVASAESVSIANE